MRKSIKPFLPFKTQIDSLPNGHSMFYFHSRQSLPLLFRFINEPLSTVAQRASDDDCKWRNCQKGESASSAESECEPQAQKARKSSEFADPSSAYRQ